MTAMQTRVSMSGVSEERDRSALLERVYIG